MSDMYTKTTEPARRKKLGRHGIAIIAAVTAAVLVLIVVFCGIPLVKYRMYWGFISDLSTDTSNYTKKGLVRCSYNGEDCALEQEDYYTLYKKLGYRTDVDTRLTPLQPQEGIVIVYANQSELYIWPLELENNEAARDSGIGIMYSGSSGRKYSYTSDKIKYASIVETVTGSEK